MALPIDEKDLEEYSVKARLPLSTKAKIGFLIIGLVFSPFIFLFLMFFPFANFFIPLIIIGFGFVFKWEELRLLGIGGFLGAFIIYIIEILLLASSLA